ncbi:unnamed protein product [Amoebophrya sp. A120]|nr:unnamed protein product [Amoebophrya sp. A120]|eukprot:GSA120T00000349001.1
MKTNFLEQAAWFETVRGDVMKTVAYGFDVAVVRQPQHVDNWVFRATLPQYDTALQTGSCPGDAAGSGVTRAPSGGSSMPKKAASGGGPPTQIMTTAHVPAQPVVPPGGSSSRAAGGGQTFTTMPAEGQATGAGGSLDNRGNMMTIPVTVGADTAATAAPAAFSGGGSLIMPPPTTAPSRSNINVGGLRRGLGLAFATGPAGHDVVVTEKSGTRQGGTFGPTFIQENAGPAPGTTSGTIATGAVARAAAAVSTFAGGMERVFTTGTTGQMPASGSGTAAAASSSSRSQFQATATFGTSAKNAAKSNKDINPSNPPAAGAQAHALLPTTSGDHATTFDTSTTRTFAAGGPSAGASNRINARNLYQESEKIGKMSSRSTFLGGPLQEAFSNAVSNGQQLLQSATMPPAPSTSSLQFGYNYFGAGQPQPAAFGTSSASGNTNGNQTHQPSANTKTFNSSSSALTRPVVGAAAVVQPPQQSAKMNSKINTNTFNTSFGGSGSTRPAATSYPSDGSFAAFGATTGGFFGAATPFNTTFGAQAEGGTTTKNNTHQGGARAEADAVAASTGKIKSGGGSSSQLQLPLGAGGGGTTGQTSSYTASNYPNMDQDQRNHATRRTGPEVDSSVVRDNDKNANYAYAAGASSSSLADRNKSILERMRAQREEGTSVGRSCAGGIMLSSGSGAPAVPPRVVPSSRVDFQQQVASSSQAKRRRMSANDVEVIDLT